jgi:hypothetical protein
MCAVLHRKAVRRRRRWRTHRRIRRETARVHRPGDPPAPTAGCPVGRHILGVRQNFWARQSRDQPAMAELSGLGHRTESSSSAAMAPHRSDAGLSLLGANLRADRSMGFSNRYAFECLEPPAYVRRGRHGPSPKLRVMRIGFCHIRSTGSESRPGSSYGRGLPGRAGLDSAADGITQALLRRRGLDRNNSLRAMQTPARQTQSAGRRLG